MEETPNRLTKDLFFTKTYNLKNMTYNEAEPKNNEN